MERIINKNIKVKTKLYKDITLLDGLIIFVFMILMLLALNSNLNGKIYLALFVVFICCTLFIKIDDNRMYVTIFNIIKFIFHSLKVVMNKYEVKLKDEAIENIKNLDVVKLTPIPFSILSNEKQDEIIRRISYKFRCQPVNNLSYLISKEENVDVSKMIDNEREILNKLSSSFEYRKLTKDEFLKRVSIVKERISTLDKIKASDYKETIFYFVTYKNDGYLNGLIEELNEISINTKILNEDEKRKFLQEYIGNREYRLSFNSIEEKKEKYTLLKIDKYPLINLNGWYEEISKLQGVTSTLIFSSIDKQKAKKNIDSAILELESKKYFKASESLDKENYIDSLKNLLIDVQNGNQAYHGVSILLKVNYKDKKQIKAKLKDLGFRAVDEIALQEKYLSSYLLLPKKLDEKICISSETLASSFPLNSLSLKDDDGFIYGVNDSIVSIDFLKRDKDHLNSNMVVIGKSGSGKSYFTKSLLKKLSTTPSKIFILDPEGEYIDLVNNLSGDVVDLGSKDVGIINPFEIFSFEDGAYFSQLQFLEEFYRLLFVDIDSKDLEELNRLTKLLYSNFNIDKNTKLSAVSSNMYPTFEDLKELVEKENSLSKDTLLLYLSKVVDNGMIDAMFNGKTSFKKDKKVIDFSFIKLLESKNKNIINAQMLLVLKFLEGEVIKGKDQDEKTIIAIDEAHLFIDEKYPAALDFMYQMAKRIRKYNGMQIMITQNLKDFVLSEEIKRKSMAIISVSQYSMIFSLSSCDVKDLIELYKDVDEINEKQIEIISTEQLGSTFFIKNSKTRTCFKVIDEI